MSTNNKIQLDYYDASFLNKILGRDYRVFDPEFLIFSHEELSRVKKVTLTGVETIQFLKYCPNIEVIHIKGLNYKNVSPESTYDSSFFNSISTKELNTLLKQLPNLKELVIQNDIHIKTIDLTHNPNIEILQLENNPELQEVVGIGSLHKLKRVRMYGNNIKYFNDFYQYVTNSLDAEENLIDISSLFAFIHTFSYLKDKDRVLDSLGELNYKGLLNVKFTEKNGMKDYNTISFGDLKTLIKNYVTIFKKYGIFNMKESEKVEYVLKYIKNNIAFAREGIQERDQFIKEYANEKGIIPDWGDKYVSHLHNSYSTFNLKRGNCEGIVNLMRIMFYILGIETEDVQCRDKRSKISNETNHALIRIKIKNTWYYFDPSFDKTSPGNYSYMTYEDVEAYLCLSLYEKEKTMGVDKNEFSHLYPKHN